jgi:hypothetical protein
MLVPISEVAASLNVPSPPQTMTASADADTAASPSSRACPCLVVKATRTSTPRSLAALSTISARRGAARMSAPAPEIGLMMTWITD